ncbi:MAG: ABC transporter transmembrane domain-containing protein [Pseudomonadales bacterium]
MTGVEFDNAAARPDDLDFRQVAQIFVRTWPFIRPIFKHLVIFLAASGVIFVYAAVLGIILVGLVFSGIIAGEPLGNLHVVLYGLDPKVFVDVEHLSDEARLMLPWPVVNTTIAMVAVLVLGGAALYLYKIWVFQKINQLMRLKLIGQLQAQSLTYHANAKTGDAIYRVYQDSAMVTEIIQAVFLEPLMFMGRYLFAILAVAMFDPWLAFIVGITFLPVFLLGSFFSSRLRVGFAPPGNLTVTSLPGFRKALLAFGLSRQRATSPSD